jgi:uncharacterized protein (TIGR03437 family)
VSLYGKDLSWNTRAVRAEDVRNGFMPTYLPGAGVTVYVNNEPAALYYVSPTQINLLMTAAATWQSARLAVTRDGVRGPEIVIPLADYAPALFQLDPDFAVATQPDGAAVTRDLPARPGDIVILYANGLGRVIPPLPDRALATAAACIERDQDLIITLNGTAVPADHILYAGVAPGFAGLYQINLRLPDSTPPNPEIRIGFGSQLSREGLRLLVAR